MDRVRRKEFERLVEHMIFRQRKRDEEMRVRFQQQLRDEETRVRTIIFAQLPFSSCRHFLQATFRSCSACLQSVVRRFLAQKLAARLRDEPKNPEIVDPNMQAMLDAARHFAQDSRHNKCHSCIVVVMTHGDYDILYGSDYEALDIHEFLECFKPPNAPFLAGKPKMFFIQACRGPKIDPGFLLEVPEYEVDAPRLWRKISINSDMLLAYSTAPHYISHRNPVNGSWFIQTVCAIFREHAYSQSITSMLEMVQKRVSTYETWGGSKQGPVHESGLTETFYFFPSAFEEE